MFTKEDGSLVDDVLDGLALAARDASGVDAVSIWFFDRTRQGFNRVAGTHVVAQNERFFPASAISDPHCVAGLLEGRPITASTCDVVACSPDGFILAWPVAVSKKTVVLVYYQSAYSINGDQIARASRFCHLARAVLAKTPKPSQYHHLKAGSVNKPWLMEEGLRRKLADTLHGPIQTKMLLLEKQVRDIRERYHQRLGPALNALTAVEEGLETLREVDVRQLSHQLHPDLIHVGLAPAMRGLKRLFDPMIQVQVIISDEVKALDSPLENAIPQEVRLGIYRIVEECLNNAVRHGHATLAQISVSCLPSMGLRVQVADDGDGFDNGASSGFGTQMSRLRARQMGGTLRYGTSLLGGAMVCLDVPMWRLSQPHPDASGS